MVVVDEEGWTLPPEEMVQKGQLLTGGGGVVCFLGGPWSGGSAGMALAGVYVVSGRIL